MVLSPNEACRPRQEKQTISRVPMAQLDAATAPIPNYSSGGALGTNVCEVRGGVIILRPNMPGKRLRLAGENYMDDYDFPWHGPDDRIKNALRRALYSGTSEDRGGWSRNKRYRAGYGTVRSR